MDYLGWCVLIGGRESLRFIKGPTSTVLEVTSAFLRCADQSLPELSVCSLMLGCRFSFKLVDSSLVSAK